MAFTANICAVVTILNFLYGFSLSQESTCYECCPNKKPIDCGDIKNQGNNQSGVYWIYPDGEMTFPVYCYISTYSGGWTVIQRRESNTDFFKTWVDYQIGFGDITGSFWLGNEKISQLTKRRWYKILIEMTDSHNDPRFAVYNVFAIGTVRDNYTLSISGYSGTAGDSMSISNNLPFTTKDADNDDDKLKNCAVAYYGGWWYRACHDANLNGLYGNTEYGKGINWKTWGGYTQSLKTVKMMIKRWSKTDDPFDSFVK